MRNLTILLISIFALNIISCSRSDQQRQILSDAERIAESYPDSGSVSLECILDGFALDTLGETLPEVWLQPIPK